MGTAWNGEHLAILGVPLTLADRIRMARRRASLTRSALAEACGVSVSAVGQWEHPSGTVPRPAHMVVIARLLDVSLQWLVSGKAESTRDANDDLSDECERRVVALWRASDNASRALALALLASGVVGTRQVTAAASQGSSTCQRPRMAV